VRNFNWLPFTPLWSPLRSFSDKDMAIFLDLDQVLVLLFDPFFSVVSEACEENGFVIKKTRCMILFLACLVTYGADS
jgi:hypothetical protein